jgi:hypothetical protein
VYVYVITFNDELGKSFKYSGHVTLLYGSRD